MRQINLKSHYDLVVIGGGIQGCAMFWEAQSRGLNTLLVDQQDFCSQTSANSLKTIHGGIRYLQTLNLARTWRSSREPEILMRIAPHLVHELACLLPTERTLKRSRPVVAAGFAFYNLIKKLSSPAGRLPRARCLSKAQLADLTPLLDSAPVTGAGMWFDAQVQHAERLGLAFVKSGQSENGDAFNYLNASVLPTGEGGPLHVRLKDNVDDRVYDVSTDSIIYCTASATRQNLENLHGFDPAGVPHFCLAMNLVVNKKYADFAIGLQSGFASSSQSITRRLLFSAPWRQATLFGTWYFPAPQQQQAGQPPTEEQISYCLEDVNKSYPGVQLRREDVARVHAGLLPVNGSPPDPENHLMEHDLILQPDQARNVFSVIPTKFTTCRVTSQKMIDRLGEHISANMGPSVSAQKVLVGGDTGSAFSDFVDRCQHRYRHLVSKPVIEQLCVNYGDRISQVMQLCETDANLAEYIPGSTSHIKAQLMYELNRGSVVRPGDFIHRRSFLGIDVEYHKEAITYCCETINSYWGYHADREQQVAEMLSITLY